MLGLGVCAGASAKEMRLVDLFVGRASGAPDYGTRAGAGATFPGPVLPVGMVQFSRDTSPGADNFAGGYSYSDWLIHAPARPKRRIASQ